MAASLSLAFEEPGLLESLASLPGELLDRLDFGLIGFDREGVVCLYNRPEADWSGLDVADVIGRPLFTVVAQCMNNYLVAQRFEDAAKNERRLDETIDYVLTWRMRPTPVKLRLLFSPHSPTRYVLIQRGS